MRHRQGTPKLSWSGRSEPQVPAAAVLTGQSEGVSNFLVKADNARLLPWLRTNAPPAALIYLDPPYAMDAHHRVERGPSAGHAYSDAWDDPGHYLQFMLDRLAFVPPLLADDGVLAVHCDWRASAWLRLLLDETFGADCFRNEIVWRRAPNVGHQAAARQLGRTADSILIYSRTPGTLFRGRVPIRSTPVELTRTGRPRGAKWDEHAKVWFTTAPRGDYTDASIAALRAQNRVHESPSGKVYIKYPLRQGDDGRWYKDQPVDTLWSDEDVRPLRHAPRAELDIGYPTQKPESLLRRLIEWATAPGDLVIDLFCGSGTTLAAAERLGRRWIGCDIGAPAIETSRARLDALGATYALLREESPAAAHLAPRPPRAVGAQ
jgi:DNA modification methylase